jgi:hypothetical protein
LVVNILFAQFSLLFLSIPFPRLLYQRSRERPPLLEKERKRLYLLRSIFCHLSHSHTCFDSGDYRSGNCRVAPSTIAHRVMSG